MASACSTKLARESELISSTGGGPIVMPVTRSMLASDPRGLIPRQNSSEIGPCCEGVSTHQTMASAASLFAFFFCASICDAPPSRLVMTT